MLRLTRARGLKHGHWVRCLGSFVAPHAGARIETKMGILVVRFLLVAPHAGARIETFGYKVSLISLSSCASRGRAD